jgi:hypothetical protein
MAEAEVESNVIDVCRTCSSPSTVWTPRIVAAPATPDWRESRISVGTVFTPCRCVGAIAGGVTPK